MINMRLAQEQNLSDETITNIEFVHEDLDKLLKHPFNFYDTPEDVVKAIEEIEFTLQGLWGFEQSSDYHTYWNKVDRCTCPHLDNKEYCGTPYNIYSGDCPFHGQHL